VEIGLLVTGGSAGGGSRAEDGVVWLRFAVELEGERDDGVDGVRLGGKEFVGIAKVGFTGLDFEVGLFGLSDSFGVKKVAPGFSDEDFFSLNERECLKNCSDVMYSAKGSRLGSTNSILLLSSSLAGFRSPLIMFCSLKATFPSICSIISIFSRNVATTA
jgi:hypothetical protein